MDFCYLSPLLKMFQLQFTFSIILYWFQVNRVVWLGSHMLYTVIPPLDISSTPSIIQLLRYYGLYRIP